MHLGALAGRPMAGLVELDDRERVDVQQRARLGPLKAPGRRLGLRAASPPRTAMALEHLPRRRAMPAGDRRKTHRPPVRPGPRLENLLLELRTQRPRTRLGNRAARLQTGATLALLGLASRHRCQIVFTVAGETANCAATA